MMNNKGKKNSEEKEDEAKKVGVVIFNHDYTEEGLAALQWASDSLLSMKPRLHILFVKVDQPMDGSDEPAEEELKSPAELYSMVAKILRKEKSSPDTNARAITFDDYVKKFGTKKVGKSEPKGLDIQKMLHGAIKKFQLDTLVLGMAALRKTSSAGTAGCIHVLLDSECTIVLIKKGPEPLKQKTTVEVPVAPVDVVAERTVSNPNPEDPNMHKETTKTETSGRKEDPPRRQIRGIINPTSARGSKK